MNSNSYTWSLYFFYRNKGEEPSFDVKLIKFKKDNFLTDYVDQLASCVLEYQINKLENVENYDGTNTKISCDKLPLSAELIAKAWDQLAVKICHAEEGKLKKVTGYLIEGESRINSRTVTMVKIGSPITNFSNSSTRVSFAEVDDELDLLNDSICRFYLNIDFFRLDDTIYTFNQRFEQIFGMAKTMDRVREHAVDNIKRTGAFVGDIERIIKRNIKSGRIFLTLNNERLVKLYEDIGREYIASQLNISLNEDGLFENMTKEELKLLIRYICNQVFIDDESKELYLVNGAKKLVTES